MAGHCTVGSVFAVQPTKEGVHVQAKHVLARHPSVWRHAISLSP